MTNAKKKIVAMVIMAALLLNTTAMMVSAESADTDDAKFGVSGEAGVVINAKKYQVSIEVYAMNDLDSTSATIYGEDFIDVYDFGYKGTTKWENIKFLSYTDINISDDTVFSKYSIKTELVPGEYEICGIYHNGSETSRKFTVIEGRTYQVIVLANEEEKEPEVTDPEVSEPDVSEPETSEPEVSEPETSKPDVSEPEVSKPEVSEPEVVEPEVSTPDVSEPEVSKPEVSEPDISQPEVSEPDVSQPEVVNPEVTSPHVSNYSGGSSSSKNNGSDVRDTDRKNGYVKNDEDEYVVDEYIEDEVMVCPIIENSNANPSTGR